MSSSESNELEELLLSLLLLLLAKIESSSSANSTRVIPEVSFARLFLTNSTLVFLDALWAIGDSSTELDDDDPGLINNVNAYYVRAPIVSFKR